MGLSLVRYLSKNGEPQWGALREGMISTIAGPAQSLAELLARGPQALDAGAPIVPLAEATLLSPVTAPCQIICQGKNYLDHLVETGLKAGDKDFNLLFTKADSTLAPGVGEVRRPPGVRLLDYELELGLVIGKRVTAGTKVTDDNLHEYVAGFVMCNDVSARDVQIPERQWFKGKSFRGFCPVGPVIFFPTHEEFAQLHELELELKVNGKTRQKARTRQLIHGPVDTLNEIARVFDLRPGDLVLTGTPGGVAMRVKPKGRLGELLSVWKTDKQKFAEFVEDQAKSPRYLKAGDLIESTIRSHDGSVDLGKQSIVVRD